MMIKQRMYERMHRLSFKKMPEIICDPKIGPLNMPMAPNFDLVTPQVGSPNSTFNSLLDPLDPPALGHLEMQKTDGFVIIIFPHSTGLSSFLKN